MNENCEKQDKYSWFKDHADTIAILSVFACAITWMNFQFTSFGNRFSAIEKEIDGKFSNIEKEMAVIKAVLLLKQIMPKELAANEDKK